MFLLLLLSPSHHFRFSLHLISIPFLPLTATSHHSPYLPILPPNSLLSSHTSISRLPPSLPLRSHAPTPLPLPSAFFLFPSFPQITKMVCGFVFHAWSWPFDIRLKQKLPLRLKGGGAVIFFLWGGRRATTLVCFFLFYFFVLFHSFRHKICGFYILLRISIFSLRMFCLLAEANFFFSHNLSKFLKLSPSAE